MLVILIDEKSTFIEEEWTLIEEYSYID